VVIKRFLRALLLSLFDVFDKGYTYHSGALAFQMLLSLVPMIIVAVNVVPLLPFVEIDKLEDLLIRRFPEHAQKVMAELFELQQKGKSTSAIALALSYFFCVGFIKRLGMSLSFVSEHKFKQRGEIFFWVFMPFMLLLGIILFSIAFFLSIYLKLIFPKLVPYLVELIYILPLGIIICTVYISFLNIRFSLTLVLVSYMTAANIALVQWGFTWYVSYIFKSSVVYGSLTTVILFLIWLNLLFLTLLVGARVIFRLGM
jgi:membrane protein